MITHNFGLYVGSDAQITTGDETFPCSKIVSIYPSAVGGHKGVAILAIDSNGVDVEFFLDDCKLVLRPMSSVTQKETEEHRKLGHEHLSADIQMPWWEKERIDLRTTNRVERLMWWIKKGFDIGIISGDRYIYPEGYTK